MLFISPPAEATVIYASPSSSHRLDEEGDTAHFADNRHRKTHAQKTVDVFSAFTHVLF